MQYIALVDRGPGKYSSSLGLRERGIQPTSRVPFQQAVLSAPAYACPCPKPPADRARGPCYFVSKVYHAQLAGADAVLVVNNVPGDDLSTAIVPEEETYQQ